jgi:DNA-binding response OmpR family regulator
VTRILVVEDERDLALALRVNLEVEGYEARLAYTGAEGIRAARADAPDLVILDLMLPDTDGYAVLAAVRAAGSDVPVIMLTARGEEVDKVRGFRAGADDYVTKPFGVMELLVRIQAVLRRAGVRAPAAPGPARDAPAESPVPAPPVPRVVHHLGEVEVDVGARLVRRGESAVVLTPKAFDCCSPSSPGAGACVAPRAAARGLGLRRIDHDAHGGRPRRGAAPQAGDARRRGAGATAWKLGLPAPRVGGPPRRAAHGHGDHGGTTPLARA